MLITIAGMDGAGKTVQAELLVEALKQDQIPVRYVWLRGQPWITGPLFKMGRALIGRKRGGQVPDDHSVPSEEVWKSYSDGKAELFQRKYLRWAWKHAALGDRFLQVRRALGIWGARGQVTVSDRYVHDWLVDLAVTFRLECDELTDLARTIWTRLVPKPALAFMIDLPPEVAFSRKDDVPSLEYLQVRRKYYLHLADLYGMHLLNGERSINAISDEITQSVRGYVAKKQ